MTKRQGFSPTTKAKRFAHCGGYCECCGIKLSVGNIEYDHDTECEDGGDNSFDNCRVLCRPCHKEKTIKFVKRIRKADRQHRNHIGAARKPPTLQSAGFAPAPKQLKASKPMNKTINGIPELARRYVGTDSH